MQRSLATPLCNTILGVNLSCNTSSATDRDIDASSPVSGMSFPKPKLWFQLVPIDIPIGTGAKLWFVFPALEYVCLACMHDFVYVRPAHCHASSALARQHGCPLCLLSIANDQLEYAPALVKLSLKPECCDLTVNVPGGCKICVILASWRLSRPHLMFQSGLAAASTHPQNSRPAGHAPSELIEHLLDQLTQLVQALTSKYFKSS